MPCTLLLNKIKQAANEHVYGVNGPAKFYTEEGCNWLGHGFEDFQESPGGITWKPENTLSMNTSEQQVNSLDS